MFTEPKLRHLYFCRRFGAKTSIKMFPTSFRAQKRRSKRFGRRLRSQNSVIYILNDDYGAETPSFLFLSMFTEPKLRDLYFCPRFWRKNLVRNANRLLVGRGLHWKTRVNEKRRFSRERTQGSHRKRAKTLTLPGSQDFTRQPH